MMETARSLRSFLTAALLAAAAACAPAEQGVVQAHAENPVIVLSEGECDQTCPVYDMTLHSDGSYALNGVKFVKTLGVTRGELGQDAWVKAEKALTDASFWTLPPDQTAKLSENCQSGAPTVNVLWRTADGKQKQLAYTAGCGGPEMRTAIVALREAMNFADLVWTNERFAPDGSR